MHRQLFLHPAAIPSPPHNSFSIGSFPVYYYGVTMAIAVLVAAWITGRRYKARNGDSDFIYDVLLWALPLGIVGARLYHVFTSPDEFFGPHGSLINIFMIRNGGLGIWGGVIGGAIGVWIAMHRAHQRVGPIADSVAPALLIAQAIGRLGNWFNQELFGGPTTLPWGLQIDVAHMPPGYPPGTLFQPTFLYEMIWNLVMAAIILLLDKRYRFYSGQVFSLYLMAYTLGRGWIEMLRIDTATTIFGLRLNVWTSILVFLIGLIAFILCAKHHASTFVSEEEHARLIARHKHEDNHEKTSTTEAVDDAHQAPTSPVSEHAPKETSQTQQQPDF